MNNSKYNFDKLNTYTRINFEQFRSEICHMLKNLGDCNFVEKILRENWVEKFWNNNLKAESLYVLAVLDYLSDQHDVPFFKDYDCYRNQKLENVLFPQSVLIEDRLYPERNIKASVITKCKNDNCSKFFIKYNIVEGDIRNVI